MIYTNRVLKKSEKSMHIVRLHIYEVQQQAELPAVLECRIVVTSGQEVEDWDFKEAYKVMGGAALIW